MRNMELLSPKIDVVFKRLFTRADSNDLLIDFIAAVLDIEPCEITHVQIMNPQLESEKYGNKNSILDLSLKVNNMLVNVEMQLCNTHDYRERILYYWSRLYCSDLKAGLDYSNLKQTIVINLLDFKMFDCEDYHSVFRLRADGRDEILTDKLRFDFLELPKAQETAQDSKQLTRLRRWMRFFNLKSKEDADMLAEKNDVMNKAVSFLHEMSADEEMRYEAWQRERIMRNEASHRAELKLAREEGAKIGEKKHERKMIFRFFRMNYDCESVEKLMGLSKEDVQRYHKEFLDNNGELER